MENMPGLGDYAEFEQGRLVEKVILWVRPYLDLQGAHYKLTWWSDGVAYYRPESV